MVELSTDILQGFALNELGPIPVGIPLFDGKGGVLDAVSASAEEMGRTLVESWRALHRLNGEASSAKLVGNRLLEQMTASRGPESQDHITKHDLVGINFEKDGLPYSAILVLTFAPHINIKLILQQKGEAIWRSQYVTVTGRNVALFGEDHPDWLHDSSLLPLTVSTTDQIDFKKHDAETVRKVLAALHSQEGHEDLPLATLAQDLITGGFEISGSPSPSDIALLMAQAAMETMALQNPMVEMSPTAAKDIRAVFQHPSYFTVKEKMGTATVSLRYASSLIVSDDRPAFDRTHPRNRIHLPHARSGRSLWQAAGHVARSRVVV